MLLRKFTFSVGLLCLTWGASGSWAQDEQSASVPATAILPAQTIGFQDGTEVSEDPSLSAYLKELQAARAALEPLRKKAPYQEGKPLVLEGSRQILGFTALANNELAVISGKARSYGAMAAIKRMFVKEPPNELLWLDAKGEVVRSAELPFLPAAVNVAPDGVIYVAGEGKVASFAADGKQIAVVDSPHIAAIVKNRTQFEVEMRARRDAELASTRESLTAAEEAVKVLQEKPEDQRTPDEKSELEMYRDSVSSLKAHLARQEKQSIEQYLDATLPEVREIFCVAASEQDIFLVTRQLGSYGFAVWRMSRDFADATQIITGLVGCCGQMDVQVLKGTLFVAENARHRVVRYDREGKQLLTFGSADRSDVEKGFGSCCNPMNTCFTADGDILTAESNGVVKRFKIDGQFVEVVGIAKIQEGCKSSSICLSTDGARLYYFDVEQGRLLVLSRS